MASSPTLIPTPQGAEAPQGTARRYDSLDALRGVAAVAVVISHLFGPILLFDDVAAPAAIRYLRLTPARALWNGGGAVLVFFVLSGFVLALPYYTGRALHYGPYLVRRTCRIYPPYLVAVIAAVLLKTLLYRGTSPTSPWSLEMWWAMPTSVRSLLDHLALITNLDERYDPVTWSLTIEMRVSILFPLLMAVLLRLPDAATVLIAMAMAAVAFRADSLVRRHLQWDIDVFQTTIYIPMFMIGALLAKHREALATRVESMPPLARDGLALFGVCTLAYGHFLPFFVWKLPITLYLATLGSSILIIAALGLSRFSTLLHAPAAVFLGRVSYSIYLWHLIVFLGLSHGFREALPTPWVQIIAFVLTFPVSALAYRWVEVPSIALGRRLSKRLEAQRSA